jgi:hypothetical protein
MATPPARTPHPLAADDWLRAWERARRLPPALRPCAWLAPLSDIAVDEDAALAEAEALPVGQRDARLLGLHAALFGPRLQATARCPRCGAAIEFELDAPAMRVDAPDEAVSRVALAHDGWHVEARLPDSRDLHALSACTDAASAREVLLRRCVTEARPLSDAPGGSPAAPPPAVVDALSRALADADPQAATDLGLACPECGFDWEEPFDIAAFLGDALDRWADRMFDEVHVLAAAYGWGEAEILALSPARRARYLAQVRG